MLPRPSFIPGRSHAEPVFSAPGGFSSVDTSGTARRRHVFTCFSCSHADLVAMRVPSSVSVCCEGVLRGSPKICAALRTGKGPPGEPRHLTLEKLEHGEKPL